MICQTRGGEEASFCRGREAENGFIRHEGRKKSAYSLSGRPRKGRETGKFWEDRKKKRDQSNDRSKGQKKGKTRRSGEGGKAPSNRKKPPIEKQREGSRKVNQLPS